jgi:hypothetical protein
MFPTPGQHAREANARINAHAEGERVREITGWEALWNGTAHDGKPSFWDRTVPLIERAPAVQTGMLATAGRRLANMVFGERAFPGLAVEGTVYGVAPLSDEERDALSALVAEIVKVAKLRKVARAYLIEGLKTGSACALCEIREGRPLVKLIPSKWCTPELDGLGRVQRLVVQYQHVGADGETYWHRRVIGDGFDRVYKPVRVSSQAVDWSKVDVAAEVAVPFVPVVWTRNAPEEVEDGFAADGHPLCEGIEAELFALDLELSQLMRNALYNGDPQMVRMGLTPDAPAPSLGGAGRTAAPEKFSWLSPSTWRAGTPGSAGKKGPGTLWDLPPGADAKLLESTGAGAQIIKTAFDEIRRAVVDSLGVVLADPQALGAGDLSARALSLMFGPMLDAASALRVDYGDALIEIVSMLARLAAAQPEGVYLTTLDAARPALARCHGGRADGATVWHGLPVACAWGEFFEPSWQDVSAAVDAATKITGGARVASQRAAMRLVSQVIGVDDLAAEAAEIEREAGGADAAMRETLTAMQPGVGAQVEAVQDTALNGAQVDALVGLAEKVTARLVPLETAVRIAMRGFQIAEADAREMLAPAAAMAPVVPVQQEQAVAPEVLS